MQDRLKEALIVAVGSRACAIPLVHVAEVMRPLPVVRLAGTPEFVRGVSVIRGAPTPVVDLGRLLESRASESPGDRLVTVKVRGRQVALGVSAILGVKQLDPGAIEALPPLLECAGAFSIEAIGIHDSRLLFVLETVRLIPDEVWAALDASRTEG